MRAVLSRPVLSVLLALGAVPALAQQSVPPQHGFDVAQMDTTCKACEDFYHYAVGGWIAGAAIPPAYSSWGSFNELSDRNQDVVRDILEQAAADRSAPGGSNTRRIGVYYATCMDSAAADREGLAPVADELARIDAIASRTGLVDEIARLQRSGTGVLFRVGSGQDDRNSAEVIAVLSQGGLGLPDRDYYLKEDSSHARLREVYRGHVAALLRLAGDSAGADSGASAVLALETALARASMTRVAQREPDSVYHRMPVADLARLAPGIDWRAYLRQVDAPGVASLNVRQPAFFHAVSGLLDSVPLSTWRTYLRANLLSSAAPYLGSAFADEAFHMEQALSGTEEQLPRWKRCLRATDGALGQALGQAYVKRTFTPAAKARALAMVKNMEAVLQDRIGHLAWMSEATRRRALAKLAAFQEKIGYPDKWRDYSALRIEPGPFYRNVTRARAFEFARRMRKIGRPVDRTEWGMTPPTVNAYYSPSMNEIVFPAGILQPPFFDPQADDALNYGGMGAVIGHEMTHGFDDQGRKYDARGNLSDWWTPEDAAQYEERAARVVSQFNGYVAVDSLHLNGKLTAGENIADLGGLTIAYAALEKSLAGKARPLIDGFTPEQRFFLAWAQIWRQLVRPERARMLVTVDPHSPGVWRVNGPLSNMPEFAQAFHCRPGDPMVRPDSVRAQIW